MTQQELTTALREQNEDLALLLAASLITLDEAVTIALMCQVVASQPLPRTEHMGWSSGDIIWAGEASHDH